MKTLLTLATAALAVTTFAAGPQQGGRNTRGMQRGPGGMQGAMVRDPIVRMVTNPKFAEKIGLTDDQKKQIKALGEENRAAQKQLQRQLRDAMEKQTDLLEEKKIDEAAVMAEIDKAFEIRKTMAKQQTKRIIAIKNILTPEQIEKALEAAKEAPKGAMGKRPEGQGKGPKCDGQGPKCDGNGPKCDGEGPKCDGKGPGCDGKGPENGEEPPPPPSED